MSNSSPGEGLSLATADVLPSSGPPGTRAREDIDVLTDRGCYTQTSPAIPSMT